MNITQLLNAAALDLKHRQVCGMRGGPALLVHHADARMYVNWVDSTFVRLCAPVYLHARYGSH
jgi:hypothetical protein